MKLLLLALACRPPAQPPPPTGSAPDTLVLVIGCTLRADRLHHEGNPRPTSPYLDALARDGTRFERMLANAPWTRPAVAALLTGLYPRRLGIDDPGPRMHSNRGLAPQVRTLAESFQDGGWATIGATANPNANAVFGFDQGFDDYIEGTDLWRKGFVKVPGRVMVDRWLQAARAVHGPLYGQLLLIDTHAPRPVSLLRALRLGIFHLRRWPAPDRYDITLAALDDAVARLDRGLAAMGRAGRMLVVTGDHGEGLMMPPKAGRAHGRQLYDANLHVPWILQGAAVPAGRTVRGLAGGIDLSPTLLELAGLPPPAGIDGRSLAAAVLGQRDDTGELEHYAETRYSAEDKARLTTPERVLLRDYRRPPRRGTELYDAADVRATRELRRSERSVAATLGQRLDALRRQAGRGALAWEGSMSEDERKQLEALGYVE